MTEQRGLLRGAGAGDGQRWMRRLRRRQRWGRWSAEPAAGWVERPDCAWTPARAMTHDVAIGSSKTSATGKKDAGAGGRHASGRHASSRLARYWTTSDAGASALHVSVIIET
jgi:hypothetical protein